MTTTVLGCMCKDIYIYIVAYTYIHEDRCYSMWYSVLYMYLYINLPTCTHADSCYSKSHGIYTFMRANVIRSHTIYTHAQGQMLFDFFRLLLFYFLATFMVISGWVLTCYSAHSWWLYSTDSLGHQAANTTTCYPTPSHYPDNQSLPYPNNAGRQARKWQVSILKLFVWLDQGSNTKVPDSNPQGSDSPIFQHGRRTDGCYSKLYGVYTCTRTTVI